MTRVLTIYGTSPEIVSNTRDLITQRFEVFTDRTVEPAPNADLANAPAPMWREFDVAATLKFKRRPRSRLTTAGLGAVTDEIANYLRDNGLKVTQSPDSVRAKRPHRDFAERLIVLDATYASPAFNSQITPK